MLDIEVVTRPTSAEREAVITKDAVKANSRFLSNALDGEFTNAVNSALEYLDGFDGVLNRSVCPWEWRIYFDCFHRIIHLPYPPLKAVSAVKYLDDDGVEQTLAGTNYIVRKNPTMPSSIVFLDVNDLPDTKADHPRAVSVTFTAGYGTPPAAEKLPELLLRGVRLLASHYIENPEATLNESKVVTLNRKIEFGLDHIINALKVPHDRMDWYED